MSEIKIFGVFFKNSDAKALPKQPEPIIITIILFFKFRFFSYSVIPGKNSIQVLHRSKTSYSICHSTNFR